MKWSTLIGNYAIYSCSYYSYIAITFTADLIMVNLFTKLIANIDKVLAKHIRSSHQSCSMLWKRCSLKFNNFHGETPVLVSFFNKFIIKRLLHRCFTVKFAKFLKHRFWRTSANDCEQWIFIIFDPADKERNNSEQPKINWKSIFTNNLYWPH